MELTVSEAWGSLGASLRSTRGPTSGWGLEPGLFWGTGVALVGLEVSVVHSLTGLLCAVLKLSAMELVAVEGGRFTTWGVESGAAGLCGEE